MVVVRPICPQRRDTSRGKRAQVVAELRNEKQLSTRRRASSLSEGVGDTEAVPRA